MHVEHTEGVVRVSLDDGKVNAINARLLSVLRQGADEAERTGAALLIEGRTGVLSGGLDLKQLPALETPVLREVLADFGALMLRLFELPRPVVIASPGHALAGGAVLLCAGDVRIGARGPFKVGLNETAIGFRLPRFVVEMARAHLSRRFETEAIVAATIYAPDDALRVGYYSELADPEQLRAVALERARALALLPAEAFAANKASLRRAPAAAGRAAYAEEMEMFMGMVTGARR